MTILTYCFFSVQYSVSSFRKPRWPQACLTLHYRSICRFGRCFGIPEPAAGLARPAITEVYAGPAAASVFRSLLQACLTLHLPKYMQVWPLLRYSRSVFRTRLKVPLPIRSKRAATDDSSLLALINLLYFIILPACSDCE